MRLPFKKTHFDFVSLIITTYNQKERLAMVLDSVLNLACYPSEVLIADDGSDETTRDLIESYCPRFDQKLLPLKHVWQEDLGFRAAKSRNNAILKAGRGDPKKEYIVITDTDMILHPHFIYDHLYFASPEVLLQGGRVILNAPESQQILSKQDFSLAYTKHALKNHRILALAQIIYTLSGKRSDAFHKHVLIPGVRSANMSFSKSDFVAIEGFNEDFIGWGREDSEFVARFLFNRGTLKTLKFCALAYHLYHKENNRAQLESNHERYLQTLKEHKISWRG